MFLSLTSWKTQVSQPFPASSTDFSILFLFWRPILHLLKVKFDQIHHKISLPSTGCLFGPTEFIFHKIVFTSTISTIFMSSSVHN